MDYRQTVLQRDDVIDKMLLQSDAINICSVIYGVVVLGSTDLISIETCNRNTIYITVLLV